MMKKIKRNPCGLFNSRFKSKVFHSLCIELTPSSKVCVTCKATLNISTLSTIGITVCQGKLDKFKVKTENADIPQYSVYCKTIRLN